MPNNQNLLDVLTREGVLLSVRYWRAAKKLQAQDLGLDPDDVTDRLISLGHKRLNWVKAFEPHAIGRKRLRGRHRPQATTDDWLVGQERRSSATTRASRR